MKSNVNVKDRYQATKTELDRISEDELGFVYATQTKYIPELGYIKEMSFKDIIKAKHILNQANTSQFDIEMKELGITEDEIDIKNAEKFLGVKKTIWVNDLKTRISELRHETKVANLNADLVILLRNLEEEDIREMDLGSLSDVVISE